MARRRKPTQMKANHKWLRRQPLLLWQMRPAQTLRVQKSQRQSPTAQAQNLPTQTLGHQSLQNQARQKPNPHQHLCKNPVP